MERRARCWAGLLLTGAVTTVLAPAPWSAVIGAALIGAAARERRRRPAIVVAALLAWGCVAVMLAMPVGWVWPAPPAAGLVVFSGVGVLLGGPGWRSWLRRGRPDRTAWALGAASVPVTTVALVAFIASGRTDLEAVTDGLRTLSPVVLVLAGVGFALVNPAVEEALFRGLLQPALVSLGARPAIAVLGQAVAFGSIHLAGVPGGPLGMVLAGTWGALLGVVRHRTEGLLLVWLVHVAANATIFTTVVLLARRDGLLLAGVLA